MYAITGASGHVGGATARALLAAGADVRVVVRDAAKGAAWRAHGAEVAVADLTDADALAAAFAGCTGAFAMLPTVADLDDAGHRRLVDAIADGVQISGVPHVVALSSVGADLVDGTGPIRWLHALERQLGRTGACLTAVRSPHFQEKVEEVLDAALGEGVYPVLGTSADVPLPMIATRDVGAVVAQALLAPPAADEVLALEAPAYSERQVAAALGTALDRELEVVLIPREGWLDAFTEAGLPPALATELVELQVAGEAGLLRHRGGRPVPCATPIETTLHAVVVACGRA